MTDLNQFIETGLWSTLDYLSGDENNNPLLDDKYNISDVNDSFKVKAQAFIDMFRGRASHLFTDHELINSPITHDLWLTCEGHGAGFWDGDYERGDELTALVKELCPCSEYWGELLNESIERGES